MSRNLKWVDKFLYAAEGIGAVFVGLYLAAYLGGLPSTAVLHSEPALRIPLALFGATLLILVLVGILLRITQPKK
jgi:hypothetical protein